MRPGLRYKAMWVVFYLVTVTAGIVAPWDYHAVWIWVGIAWAICAYISYRQVPAKT